MMGSAVSEPPPFAVRSLAARFQQARVEVEHVARDTLRVPAGAGAAAKSPGRPRRAWKDRRRPPARALPLSRRTPRPWRTRRRARCTGAAPGRRRPPPRLVYSMAPCSSSDLHHLGHGRLLLADGHVDAMRRRLVRLVDDGVDGDGRLAGLPVADDQLALSAADGDHRVDGLEAGLQRLLHRLTVDHARGCRFEHDETCS